jgi:uncharacterized protein
MGLAYKEGRGVDQNDEEAVKWYRAAADQGHADGQFLMGVAYKDGQGVDQSDEEAVQ